MRRSLPLIALGVAAAAALGVAVHALASNPVKALVYCPVGIDTIGCSRIVAALSGSDGPFAGGVDRGYDGTAGTVDLATADLSPYAVFIIPSLADDPDTKPYNLLRSSQLAYRLSMALRGRLVVWSGTPDQGSAYRPEKDQLIRNLAVWARAGTANPGTGLVVLQDHSADAAARYGWLKGFAGLAVRADAAVAVYDNVVALTDAAREILNDGSGQLAYPNMASFGLQPPAAGSGAAADARGESTERQVVLLTSPRRLASVATDKADYAPGETVTFTGSGWQPGEIVSLLLHEDPTTDADRTLTATADASGNIFNSEFSPEPHDIGVTFYVIASGETSGLTAQAKFTDAPPKANLDQCRNGPASAPQDCIDASGPLGWENGDANATQAHLLEGYSIPYRVVMTDLPTATTITLDIGYDIKQMDKHALDYLTHYQRLEPHTFFGHPAETVTPTSGVSGIASTTTTSAIPAPSSAGSPLAGEPTNSFNALPASERVMTLFGGTISGVAYVSEGSLTASQAETVIRVTFTAASATAVLAWGGHIAEASVWGAGNSAGAINGSPYHMRLKTWSLGNLGNQDRALAAGAVVVQKATPTLVTAPQPSSATVGATLNDDATLAGGFGTLGGTITVKLFSPSDASCQGTAAYTDAITVSGAATYHTATQGTNAGGFTANATGTWNWTADYSGDGNNDPASKGCGTEPVTVNKATVTFSTAPQPSSATVGATLNDDATLAGGFGSLGGTITFKLYSPNAPTCTGTPAYRDVVTVNGAATYHTATQGDNPGGSTATALGTWNWTADYSGDAKNDPASSVCGDEEVTITAVPTADLEVSKSDAPDPVSPGGNITYTLVVTNNGPSAAMAVTLTDPVPLLTTFVSLSAPSGWTCTTSPAGLITGTTVSLAVSSPATFTLVVQVNPITPGGTVITNTATVISPTPDPNQGNNSATAETMVSAGCAGFGVCPPPGIF